MTADNLRVVLLNLIGTRVPDRESEGNDENEDNMDGEEEKE